jgi:hypothetical protein
LRVTVLKISAIVAGVVNIVNVVSVLEYDRVRTADEVARASEE